MFNIQRTFHFFRYRMIAHASQVRFILIASSLLFFCWITHEHWQFITFSGALGPFILIGIFYSLLHGVSFLFKDINDESMSIQSMMFPVTAVERIVVGFVAAALFFAVMMSVFFITELSLIALEATGWLPNTTSWSTMQEDFAHVYGEDTFLLYFLATALVLLGMVTFKTAPIGKVLTISTSLFVVLILLDEGLNSRLHSHQEAGASGYTYYEFSGSDSTFFADNMETMLWLSIPIVLFIAYLKLKEKQV